MFLVEKSRGMRAHVQLVARAALSADERRAALPGAVSRVAELAEREALFLSPSLFSRARDKRE